MDARVYLVCDTQSTTVSSLAQESTTRRSRPDVCAGCKVRELPADSSCPFFEPAKCVDLEDISVYIRSAVRTPQTPPPPRVRRTPTGRDHAHRTSLTSHRPPCHAPRVRHALQEGGAYRDRTEKCARSELLCGERTEGVLKCEDWLIDIRRFE
jgi:hypothetical protein